jgi:hypothetical protein
MNHAQAAMIIAAGLLGAAGPVRTLDVVLESDAAQPVIGRVQADPASHLSIVSVRPDYADWLGRIVNEANAADYEHEPAAPPAGASPTADYARVIERSSTDFFPALRAHLRSTYQIDLR